MTDPLGDVDLIVFDLSGNLVEITTPMRPYDPLLRGLDAAGLGCARRHHMPMTSPSTASRRRSGSSRARRLWRRRGGCGSSWPRSACGRGSRRSSRLRRGAAWPYALCSNLLADYAAPAPAIAAIRPVRAYLSFAVGMTKPDPARYAAIVKDADLPAHRILFAGDSLENDMAGPRRAGMRALPIDPLTGSLAG